MDWILWITADNHLTCQPKNMLLNYTPGMFILSSLNLKHLNHVVQNNPDQISPKLVKEFASYELSVPFTDILNSSYSESVVPVQWKKAIVVPIPIQQPPSIDMLRPVSLTSKFAKVAEGFITNWVLEDIDDKTKLTPANLAMLKGFYCSLFSFSDIHFLFQGAEKSQRWDSGAYGLLEGI